MLSAFFFDLNHLSLISLSRCVFTSAARKMVIIYNHHDPQRIIWMEYRHRITRDKDEQPPPPNAAEKLENILQSTARYNFNISMFDLYMHVMCNIWLQEVEFKSGAETQHIVLSNLAMPISVKFQKTRKDELHKAVITNLQPNMPS